MNNVFHTDVKRGMDINVGQWENQQKRFAIFLAYHFEVLFLYYLFKGVKMHENGETLETLQFLSPGFIKEKTKDIFLLGKQVIFTSTMLRNPTLFIAQRSKLTKTLKSKLTFEYFCVK